MHAEIIAVGSELLTPQRADTNSLFLTERLNRRGIEVVRKVIVGDDEDLIANEISRSLSASDIVILSGGLGPTLDDLTRQAVAKALGRGISRDPEIVEWIASRFRSFGREMAENNKRQADVIDGAEILPNPNGTAPGQWIEADGKIVMMLPGPPREIKAMFVDQCEPRLDRIPSEWRYSTVTLRISGMGESDVDHLVGPIYAAETRVATTILSAPGDISLHFRGRAKVEEEARELAQALAERAAEALGDVVYSWQNESLEAAVGRMLREQGLTLAVAESCTGGLVAEKITSVPGSSEYFAGALITYSEGAKADWLGVRAETIKREGAVSEATAAEMAERARELAGGVGRGIGVSTTGVAGPGGGTEETPVGTVFFGIAGRNSTTVKRRQLGANRDRNRRFAAQIALELLRRELM